MAELGFFSTQSIDDILNIGDILPGDKPSYQHCQKIYMHVPVARKMVNVPILLMMARPRLITVQDSPGDEAVKAFEKTWQDLRCDRHIADVIRYSRIFGAAAIALRFSNIDGFDYSLKDTVQHFWGLVADEDIHFAPFTPLNCSGSLSLDQNPDSRHFMRPKPPRIGRVRHCELTAHVIHNGSPLYLEFNSSSFGFTGFSVFQPALIAIKGYLTALKNIMFVLEKAGVMVVKSKGTESQIWDETTAINARTKLKSLLDSRINNALMVGQEDDITSLNLQNLDSVLTQAMDSIMSVLAQSEDMPKFLLNDELLSNGLSDGSNDAKRLGQFLEAKRKEVEDLYEWMTRIVMRKAWTPDFCRNLNREGFYKGATDEAIFQKLAQSFEATWPDLVEETAAQKLEEIKAKIDALKQLGDLLVPNLDPVNKAEFVRVVAETFNGMGEVFTEELNFDYEALQQYEPPQPQQQSPFGGMGIDAQPNGFIAADAETGAKHWITLNGGSGDDGHGGSRVLLDGNGNIVGGAGGKLDGKKLDNVKSKSGDVSERVELTEKIAKAGQETHGGDLKEYLSASQHTDSSAGFARTYEKHKDKVHFVDDVLGKQEFSKDGLGKVSKVKTAKGTEIETRFKVVDAADLIASHDLSGNENPNFPQELQPRDRSKQTSQAWVQKTAKNLDVDSLGKTRRADSGAPIIGDDGVVESGNGRTMAIMAAYQGGHADEYREWLESEAADFGIDPATLKGMKNPVLVRQRVSDVDRSVFTKEANEDDKLAMTATEKARSDASKVNAGMISQLSGDGDLRSKANRPFIDAFMKQLSDSEAAQYYTTSGELTKQIYDRVQSAVFSKAYNDDRLLELMADDSKPEVKNIITALTSAAPGFIQARDTSEHLHKNISETIADGVHVSLDKQAIDALVSATNAILESKNKGLSLEDYLAQTDVFGEGIKPEVAQMALFIKENNRSAAKMSEAFNEMANVVNQELAHEQTESLFGDEEPKLNLADIVSRVREMVGKKDKQGEPPKSQGGFIDVFTETKGQAQTRRDFEQQSSQGSETGEDFNPTHFSREHNAHLEKTGKNQYKNEQGETIHTNYAEDLQDAPRESKQNIDKVLRLAPELKGYGLTRINDEGGELSITSDYELSKEQIDKIHSVLGYARETGGDKPAEQNPEMRSSSQKNEPEAASISPSTKQTGDGVMKSLSKKEHVAKHKEFSQKLKTALKESGFKVTKDNKEIVDAVIANEANRMLSQSHYRLIHDTEQVDLGAVPGGEKGQIVSAVKEALDDADLEILRNQYDDDLYNDNYLTPQERNYQQQELSKISTGIESDIKAIVPNAENVRVSYSRQMNQGLPNKDYAEKGESDAQIKFTVDGKEYTIDQDVYGGKLEQQFLKEAIDDVL